MRRERIVAEELDGIDPMFEAFYLEAIVYAAGRAVKAFDRYDAAISEGKDEAAIVSNAHEALSHSAAVSRFFWPARSKNQIHQRRAEKLRKAFGVPDNSPLCARDLRNALEHFDERLDEYLLRDITGYVFPAPMVSTASVADEELGHVFRLVDPSAEVFVLFGNKYAFSGIREAVTSIYNRAKESSDTVGRLPEPT